MTTDQRGTKASSPPLRIVATCAAGLEQILAEEIASLGAPAPVAERGGVVVAGDWPLVWRLNWRLRSANRVVVELGRFRAWDRPSLYAGVRDVVQRRVEERGPFGALFDPRATLAVTATSLASRLGDVRLAALVTKDGIVDAQRHCFGRRSDVDRAQPDLPLRLRIHHDEATLLLDTSGDPLDRRGYRVESTAAPAREQLVAAAVLASRWDGRGPVLDPMCGSGTFLAEAGAIALGLSPARLRQRFAFEGFPTFSRAAWQRVRQEPIPAPGPHVELYGVDRDHSAINATRQGLERAGLGPRARLHIGEAFETDPPDGGPGLVCVNPPWGLRLEDSEAMWRDLGDWLKRRFAGWKAVLLAGDERQGAGLGLRPKRFPVRAGAAELRILVVDLY